MKSAPKHWRQLGVLLLVLLVVPVLALYGFATQSNAVQEPVCYVHGDVNGDGVVDHRDAIHTLYHTIYPDDADYSVAQDCDFDQDGTLDSKDAIYVLYATFDIFADEYPLKGTVHEYYDPEWTWAEDGTVTANFKCGCGGTTDVAATVSVASETEVTCVAAGVKTVAATVEFNGTTYTDTRTTTTQPTGHELTGEQGCETSVTCSKCDYTQPALGHNWVQTASTEATCTAYATQTFTCSVCQETQTVTGEEYAPHSYAYVEDVVDGCGVAKKFACACGDAYTEDAVYSHVYTATLTKEATCSEVGEMTYTCTDCGSSYTEEIPVNSSHAWGEGVVDGNVTTFTCACGETKTAIVVEDTSAEVSKEELSGNELQINDAAITMDEAVLEDLGDATLTIQVDTVAVEDLTVALDEELASQIVDGVVYDFNLYCGDEQVSDFNGEITISLPYELQEGDDVECIDVWYINDDGEAECVQGTYSNGEVTFTTTHFSYYTVTRLTPAQRCAHYGHMIGKHHKDATCTAEGYHMESCRRCGDEDQEVNEVLPALGHSYAETVTAATCTEDGSVKNVCSTCKHATVQVLPKTGHNYVADSDQHVAATCTAAGQEVYVCANEGCADTYTVDLKQLDHELSTTEQAADCTTKGYKTTACANCDYSVTEEIAPIGHNYLVKEAVWTWVEDYSGATLTIKCGNDETHTLVLEAVISVENATCANLVTTYTATVSYNGVAYQDAKSVEVESAEHRPGEELSSTATEHYYVCTVCGTAVGNETHTFTETVTKEPTCVEGGTALSTCDVCGYEKSSVLAATGKHNYADGVCVDCGWVEGSCSHETTVWTPVDVTALGICEGSELGMHSCECGENSFITYDLNCALAYVESYEKTTADGLVYEVESYKCAICGLVYEYGYAYELIEEDCITLVHYWAKFSMNGTAVLETSYIDWGYEHHTNIVKSTIDLSEKGLCGLTVYERTCYCGEETYTYANETGCDFYYSSALSTDGADVYVCAGCGAQWKREYNYEKDSNCYMTETDVHTVTLNGAVVATWTNVWNWYEHDWEVTKYTLHGASCNDGVTVEETCADCGATNSYDTDGHEYVIREEVDLSDKGYCLETVYLYECACGAYEDYGFSYGEESCEWNNHDGGYPDENTYVSYAYCVNCGLERVRTTVYDYSDSCYYTFKQTVELKDVEGNVLVTAYRNGTGEDHDYTTVAELIGGTSCENGVRYTRVCNDCGYSYTDVAYYHMTYKIAKYDLADYGMCGGYVELYGCACGYDAWMDWNWDCSFGWFEDGKAFCNACDTYYFSSVEVENLGGCNRKETVSRVFSRNDVTLLELNYTNRYESHRYVWEYTLKGETCEDGWTGLGTCASCGATTTTNGSSHSRRAVKRTPLTNGELCGELEYVEYACACGQQTNANAEWVDESKTCNFDSEYYDEKLGGWVYTCSECGVGRLSSGGTSNRDEETCLVTEKNTYTYFRNGETLFTYDYLYNWYSHDYKYTFEMNGETCADGYYVNAECLDCGAVYYHYDYRNYCTTWKIGEEVLYTTDCGDVYQVTYSCPCGAVGHSDVYDSCDWSWYDWDQETGLELQRCDDCGLIRSLSRTEGEKDENCCYEVTCDYVYYVDGNQVATGTASWTNEEHDYLYSYKLEGESCDEGYYLTRTCQDCGYSYTRDYLSYGCNSRKVAEEVLYTADCGEIKLVTYSCACGGNHSVELESDCNWYWGTNELYGEYQYCYECGLVRTWWENELVEGENCSFSYTTNHTFYTDVAGEMAFTCTTEEAWTDHLYTYTFTMDGTTCDDGYSVTGTCVNCGDTYTSSGYSGCSSWLTKVETVYTTDCGDVVSYTYSCPCGSYSYERYGTDCNWYYGGWDEELECEYRYCVNCGLIRTYDEYYTEKDENCRYQYGYNYTFWVDGEAVATVRYSEVYTDHRTVYTFQMMGETCDDGYYPTGTCLDCGKVYTYGLYEGCSTWCVGYETVYTSACGDFQQVQYACPCGEWSYVRWSTPCRNMQWVYDEETGEESYVCQDCGVELVYGDSYKTAKDENCRYKYVEEYIYYVDGVETFKLLDEELNTSHAYVYTLTLVGETCADGYYRSRSCLDCGDTYASSSVYYGCGNYRLSRTVVHDGTGICGPIYQYTTGCACGAYAGTEVEYSCSFRWTWDDELDTSYYQCECGLIRSESSETTEKDENCRYQQITTYTFTLNGEVVATAQYIRSYTNHRYIHTYEMYGETCDDGYDIYRTCADCGYSEQYSTGYIGCYSRRTGIETVIETDCGVIELYTYSCPCGAYQSTDLAWDLDCSFSSSYDSDLEAWVYTCSDCGLSYYSEYFKGEKDENCRYQYGNNYTFTYGDQTVTAKDVSSSTNHRYVYTFDMDGETCEDGYDVYFTCLDCGASGLYDTEYYYCNSWRTGIETLVETDCGEVYLETYSCPCGAYQSTDLEWDLDCSFSSSYDSDLEAWVYTCSDCGLSYYSEYFQGEKDENCRYQYGYNYTFTYGDQTVTAKDVSRSTNHRYVYTFDMDGETCEDGYDVYWTCLDCGATDLYSEGYTWCETWRTGIETVVETDCGVIELYTYACACGAYQYTDVAWDLDCSFSSSYDSDTCSDCGLSYYSEYFESEKDENCRYQYGNNYTFTYGDQTVTAQEINYSTDHRTVYTFDMYGETCEDGYDVYWTCLDCGATDLYSSGYYYCYSRRTGIETVVETDCGAIELYTYACACGANGYTDLYWGNSDCSFSYSYDSDLEMYIYTCSDCGLSYYYEYFKGEKDENCRYQYGYNYTFTYGDQTATAKDVSYSTDHRYVVDTFVMDDEALGCEGGVTVTMVCMDCGDSYESSTSYHSTYTMKYVDVSGYDVCGVNAYYQTCACGQNSYVSINMDCSYDYDSWYDDDTADGYRHYYRTYTCETCPFSYQREYWYAEDVENCREYTYNTYTFYIDGEQIEQFETSSYSISHTYGDPDVALKEGSTTCDDGVVLTYTCQYCDYSYTSNSYYHYTYATDNTVNLQDYGAVCETYLTEYACACGAYVSMELTGDTMCDMDWNWTSSFVEGTLTDSQPTIDGWVYPSYDAYILTCAVTDPQCAFKIRYSKYYLAEDDCTAVQYQTWQIGYDADTETCQFEITVATGRTMVYHDYAYSYTTTELDDGGEINTTSYICNTCGSYYIQEYTYNANGYRVKYEETYSNKLDNGQNKWKYYVSEYGLEYDGSLWATHERREYIYADGSEYWYDYTYEYDFTCCQKTTYYTCSDGSDDTWTDDIHSWRSTYVLIEDSTCTQYGYYRYDSTCTRCGAVSEGTYQYTYYPNGHSWVYDTDLGYYVCSECGLENINGADGTVILEDLTEEYGAGTHYVAGYYNQDSSIEFTKYVSVILKDVGEDEENELLLEVELTHYTEKNDGYNAYAFSIADAEAAALAAMEEAGYTGAYAFRFTFVPKTDDATLDYAITFDSLAE